MPFYNYWVPTSAAAEVPKFHACPASQNKELVDIASWRCPSQAKVTKKLYEFILRLNLYLKYLKILIALFLLINIAQNANSQAVSYYPFNSQLSICSIDRQIKMLFELSSMDDILETFPSQTEFYSNYNISN